MKKISFILVIALIAWMALFLSSKGILISSTEKQSAFLECEYFTGTGTITKKFLNSAIFGKQACPRITEI